ncbi:MAG: hypothetical protein LLG20_25520 [Acidobacteriales bacterium]|nr:hypothetical protein [Terriglobales bacterium]
MVDEFAKQAAEEINAAIVRIRCDSSYPAPDVAAIIARHFAGMEAQVAALREACVAMRRTMYSPDSAESKMADAALEIRKRLEGR